MKAAAPEVVDVRGGRGEQHQQDFAHPGIRGNRPESLQSVAASQRHPEDDQFGAHRQHPGESFLSTGGFDNLEIFREMGGNRLAVRRIIINDDQSGMLNHEQTCVVPMARPNSEKGWQRFKEHTARTLKLSSKKRVGQSSGINRSKSSAGSKQKRRGESTQFPPPLLIFCNVSSQRFSAAVIS